MSLFLEIDAEANFGFSIQEVAEAVMETVLDLEACPYEASVNLLITDDEKIREMNREYRDIDRETDVLSFPAISYETPGDFSKVEEDTFSAFDPDSGELLLGDIVINTVRVRSQAAEYDHSVKREFAFLVAHSMYHLCGYDHMEKEEALVMEQKQEAALQKLGITRES